MNKSKIYASIFELLNNPNGPKSRRLKEELKGALRDELERPENVGRTYPIVLNEFAYREYLSPQARKAGMGLEHIVDFLNWLDSEMEMG